MTTQKNTKGRSVIQLVIKLNLISPVSLNEAKLLRYYVKINTSADNFGPFGWLSLISRNAGGAAGCSDGVHDAFRESTRAHAL